jgi:hypothetical protein
MTDETLVLTKQQAVKRHVSVHHRSQLGPSTKIPIAEIVVGERMIPEDAKVVAQLKLSLREVRQTTPVLVRRNSNGGYTLIDGLNRLAALKELGETECLAAVLEVSSEEEAKACEAISNRHRRQGLTALDRALTDFAFVSHVASKVLQNAAPRGGRQPKEKYYAKTAKELGVSADQIARSCKIAKIVPQVQRAIRDYGQEDNQNLLLEVAKSGDDYSAQVFTLTRLMNKVPEPAEQSWTDRLPPPANLGANDSPQIAAAATPENQPRDGLSEMSGPPIRSAEASQGKNKNELASGHHESPKPSAPATVRNRERVTEIHHSQRIDVGAGMRVHLLIPGNYCADFAKLRDGANIKIRGFIRASTFSTPSVEADEIVEITQDESNRPE